MRSETEQSFSVNAGEAPCGEVTAVVGMGSNLGDRYVHLVAAGYALRELPACRAFRFSAIFETGAVGCPESPPFLNAVASFQTRLPPRGLLRYLLDIEKQQGRRRPYPNAPRSLDLDLLLFGSERIATPELTVPHPRMKDRLFVLIPLADVGGRLLYPGLEDAIRQLETQNYAENVIVKSQWRWPPELTG